MNGKVSIFYMKTPSKKIRILALDAIFRSIKVGTIQRGGLSPQLCAGINIRKRLVETESVLEPCTGTNIL